VNLLNTILTVVLVAATLVTVWFARQAASDGHKAATAAQETADAAERTAIATAETVTGLRRVATAAGGTVEELERVAAQLRQVAEHSRSTVSELRNVAERTRQTVEIAKAAAAADAGDRQLRRIRDIAGLVETIFWRAAAETKQYPAAWRCPEQNELDVALAAYPELLPDCARLSHESQAVQVLGAAADAREEVQHAVDTLVMQLARDDPPGPLSR
jgi:hypothetical protein